MFLIIGPIVLLLGFAGYYFGNKLVTVYLKRKYPGIYEFDGLNRFPSKWYSYEYSRLSVPKWVWILRDVGTVLIPIGLIILVISLIIKFI